MKIKSAEFNSEFAPRPVGLYPHAKQVNNFIFLSGIGPRKANSSDIPGVTLDDKGRIISYDIKEQCHSVFKNIDAVLKSAGTLMKNLIDITVYLTNIRKDFKIYNAIYAEYFKDYQPCRTTVGIVALPTPIAIELKCVAIV
jgi:2-aminomuconate deaminase